MGWFLSRSDRRRKPKRARKPASGAGAKASWDPQRTLVALKILGAVGAIVGTVYGWGRLERELTAYATETRTQPPAVELLRQPAWMSPVTAAKLKSTAEANLSADPMDRVGLVKTAEALSRNPWVAEVRQVRRATAGRVVIDATYRQPSAVIRTNHGYYLVDKAGVWLPTDNREHLKELPIVTGITAPPPKREGDAWTGDEVASAMALVEVLRDEPYLNQVVAIDASARDARGRVKLVLYSPDSWVVWGLAPGQEKMVEPEAQVKLSRLRRVFHGSGTIDAAGKGVYLNGATIMTARAER